MNQKDLNKEGGAFGKAQISAFVGGMIDYFVMLFFVECLALHYVIGIFSGGIIGAIVNFSINRYWSFNRGRQKSLKRQLGKFCFVVIGSIILKSSGTTLLTEGLSIDYRISRIITDVIVSFGFNYSLQRFWVFGQQMKS